MMPRSSTDIYLDANATTRVWLPATQAAQNAMEDLYGNPSSNHITGLRSRYILESTRQLITTALGARLGRIVFTSGATEAIQMAVFSALCRLRERPADRSRPRLLYGATEHKAVPEALNHWNQVLGIHAEVLAIPVNTQGLFDLDFLEEHAPHAALVCTMAVNNETGVIHDLPSIEAVLRAANPTALWLVDLVQGVGKIDIDLANTTIDYAPVSGHKLHAPKGIGFLYVRQSAPLTPLFAGGGQEQGARSGTENLPGVAALGAVFEGLTAGTLFQDTATLCQYRDRLVASLQRAFPRIEFNTPFDGAVPTTINFAVPGFTSKELLDLFDAAGIRVSSGSACGSALLGSYVLEAMGLPVWRSEGAIRVSFSPTVSPTEIDMACQRIKEAGQALSASSLLVSDRLETTNETILNGLIQLKKGSMCSWVLLDAATRHCIIIDPFEELAERIDSLVRCQNAQVLAILDTHNHVDHTSTRQLLLQVLGDHVARQAHTHDPLGWPNQHDGKVTLGDGSQASYLRLTPQLILARTMLPGHTLLSEALLVGRATAGRLDPEAVQFAFLGDTLLIGGLGRTDLPSSSPEALYASLQKLPQIIAQTTLICPTHDYTNHFATTLAAERVDNPLLDRLLDPVAPIDLDTFLAEKAEVDREIVDIEHGELMCGRVRVSAVRGPSLDVRPEALASFFADHRDALIVDVREPHEYRLTSNWGDCGLDRPPENVPLTRLAAFAERLLHQPEEIPTQDMILVCRSGNRSQKAAEVLCRLGITNVWHIAGGIALGGSYAARQRSSETVEYII